MAEVGFQPGGKQISNVCRQIENLVVYSQVAHFGSSIRSVLLS